MKIDDQLQKLKSMERTLNKLDEEGDYGAIIELCMLISAHYVNVVLHKLRITSIDRNVKHNKLVAEIERRAALKLVGAREAMNALEQLRPRHVYGRGSDGKVGKRALESIGRVQEACTRVLG